MNALGKAAWVTCCSTMLLGLSCQAEALNSSNLLSGETARALDEMQPNITACPLGYVEPPPDSPNEGSYFRQANGILGVNVVGDVDSVEICGDLCREDPGCRSFQYSLEFSRCSKYETNDPTGPWVVDNVFCMDEEDDASTGTETVQQSCPYGYDVLSVGVADGPTETAESHSGVPSPEHCAAICSQDIYCRSFTYKSTEETCQVFESTVANGPSEGADNFLACQRHAVFPHEDFQMSPLRKTLFILPMISGPISFCSSLYLLYLIIRVDKNKFGSPKQQLLCGISCLEMCSSFAFSFSTLPGPESWIDGYSPEFNRRRYPSIGSIETCAAQGFLVQLGLVGVPLYNTCLCFYYVLAVRYNVQDRQVAKMRLIPIMHFIVLSFAFSSAIFLLAKGFFNFDGMLGCWINPGRLALCDNPDDWGCHYEEVEGEWRCLFNFENTYQKDLLTSDECARGDQSNDYPYQLYFAMIPIILAFICVIFSLITLYVTVRGIEKKSRQWRPEASYGGNSSEPRRGTLTQRTMETGVLYGLAFILVYFPSGLDAVVLNGESTTEDIMQVLSALLTPLQGLFNLLIYTAPKWMPAFQHRFTCKSRADAAPLALPRSTQAEASRSIGTHELSDEEGARHRVQMTGDVQDVDLPL